MSRVFRRPYGRGPYCVSVQASFTDKASAVRFAKALDRLKADAAIEGLSFSRRLLAAVSRRQIGENP